MPSVKSNSVTSFKTSKSSTTLTVNQLLSHNFHKDRSNVDNKDVIYTLVSLSDYSFQYCHEVDIKLTESEVHILLSLLSKVQKCIFSGSVKHIVLIMSYYGFLDTLKSYLIMLAEEGIFSATYNWNIFFNDLLNYFTCLTQFQSGVNSKFKKVNKKIKYCLFISKELIYELVKHRHIICNPTLLDKADNLLHSFLNSVKLPESQHVHESQIWDPYPSANEIFADDPAKLNSFDVYSSLESYLKYQFLLMKEDYLSVIRDGLIQYKESIKFALKREKNFDVFVYKSVAFIDHSLNPNSIKKIGYTVQINDDNQLRRARTKKSKRLLYGSLLLFSQDNFNSFFLGIVNDRKHIQEGDNIIEVILVKKSNDDNIFGINFTMIESSVFFEPYYQVLCCLKVLPTCHYSMNNYLISDTVVPTRPKYLSANVCYDIFNYQVNLCQLKHWPSHSDLNMDIYQLEALKQALTSEFSLIQGPPGTGKTYLGLKIVEILIKNKKIWNSTPSPILIICYTNHALDQFLEGLLPITDKIVRIGGQSKSKLLINYNLKLLRKKSFKKIEGLMNLRSNIRRLIAKRIDAIVMYRKSSELIKKNLGVLHYSILLTVMSPHEKSYLNCEDTFVNWLIGENNDILLDDSPNNNSVLFSKEPKYQMFKNDFEDVETVLKYQFNLCQLEYKLIDLSEKIDSKRVHDLTPQEIKSLIASISDFITELSIFKVLTTKLSSRPPEQVAFGNLRESDLSKLEPRDRWTLYFMWQDELVHQMNNKFKELIDEHDELCDFFKEACNMEDYANIQEFGTEVIGVTTTGAARYNTLLSILKPRIVLVEEAAEIMEAHTVTSLTRTCQHVIMIGDHFQLRPSTATYALDKYFNLSISLFERLVKQGMPVSTLRTQRRMRPEISALVTPLIYKKLTNHSLVYSYPDVRGITKNVFFINHCSYEEEVEDSHSHKNIGEADFLLALCRYLIKQGYDPSEITILTTYVAQESYMISKKLSDKMLKEVRITVVDNYQGEENNIILLSLVRSNPTNNIGYLSSRNRMCVALTRAKLGMYIVGNMDCLSNSSDLWTKLRSTLVKTQSFGKELELICQIHGNTNKMSLDSDWSKICHGGCEKVCHSKLPCGHNCNKICHGININHETLKCGEKCQRVCINGHPCKLLCFEKCDRCSECEDVKSIEWKETDQSQKETSIQLSKLQRKKSNRTKQNDLDVLNDVLNLDNATLNNDPKIDNSYDEFGFEELNLECLISENSMNDSSNEILDVYSKHQMYSKNDDSFIEDNDVLIVDQNSVLNERETLENNINPSDDLLDTIETFKLMNFDDKEVEKMTYIKKWLVNFDNCSQVSSELNLTGTDSIPVDRGQSECIEDPNFDLNNFDPILSECKNLENALSSNIQYSSESHPVRLDNCCQLSGKSMKSLENPLDLTNQILSLNHSKAESVFLKSEVDIPKPDDFITEQLCEEDNDLINSNGLNQELLISSSENNVILDESSIFKFNEGQHDLNNQTIFKGDNANADKQTSPININQQIFALMQSTNNSVMNVSEELISLIKKKSSSFDGATYKILEQSKNISVSHGYNPVATLHPRDSTTSLCTSMSNLDDFINENNHTVSGLNELYKSLNTSSFEISEKIIETLGSDSFVKIVDNNMTYKAACGHLLDVLHSSQTCSKESNVNTMLKNDGVGAVQDAISCEEELFEKMKKEDVISQEFNDVSVNEKISSDNSMCHKFLECGHPCIKKCQKDQCETKKCEVYVSIYLPCGHVNNVKCYLAGKCYEGTVTAETLMEHCSTLCNEVLTCGHTCQGTCSSCSQGRLHELCSQICGKTLICGHKCTMYCWEDSHICVENCFSKCIHMTCNFKCKEECAVCQEKCEWTCEHYSCTMTCGELCDRPPCMLACKSRLPCSHPCTGFCGEPCPPLCLECEPLEEFNLFMHRFVLLEECGHYFEWSYLLNELKINELSLKCCPTCQAPIWKTLRLKNLVIGNNWQIRNVVRSDTPDQVFNVEMKSRILSILTFLRNHISEEVLCNSNFKLLLQYTVDNMGLILNGVKREQRHLLKSLLFIQMYLKGMSNFTNSYDVFALPAHHRQLIFLRINLLLKQLYKRKGMGSSQYLKFEYEFLKIHRIAAFFLLFKDYHECKRKIARVDIIQELISHAYVFVNSTKSYCLKDDLKFFDILNNIKKLIKSALPLCVDTEMFKHFLKNSLMSIFIKKHCHEGRWKICHNSHVYQLNDILDNQCNSCP